MASEVEICNLALGNIRAGSINSLDESGLQAETCKLRYPIVRDMLLAIADWNFAMQFEALAVRSETIFGWVYVYQVPSDCLHISKLQLNYATVSANDVAGSSAVSRRMESYYQPDLDAQVKYKRIALSDNTQVILANDSNLRAWYRARMTDTTRFSPEFVMALSWLLAAEIAVPIVGSGEGRALRKDALSIYKSELAAAVSSNENEEYSPPPESEHVLVRS